MEKISPHPHDKSKAMTVEAVYDGKWKYFSWDSSRPEEEMLEKEGQHFGFVIKVKVCTEGWEYDELNAMLNF